MCNLYSLTKGQQAIREFARAMSDTHGQSAALSGHLSGLRGPDRAQSAGRPRTRHGALGHAVACLRAEGQEVRSGRHQCPQCEVAALAPMARRRTSRVVPFTSFSENEALPDGTQPPVWFALRRDPAARFLRRHLDQLDVGPESEGRRDEQRHLRISDDRAERGRGADPSESHARHSDDAGRDRPLDDRACGGGAEAAAAASRRCPHDRRKGRKRRTREALRPDRHARARC